MYEQEDLIIDGVIRYMTWKVYCMSWGSLP
jgi:hypothetical protein